MPAESPLRDRRDADFELIETLRWEPEAGFVHLEDHLARLDRSARALSFSPPDDPRRHLDRAVSGIKPLRVRLTCAPDGRVTVATQPYTPLPEGIVWRLKIARQRINSTDTLLAHKTSRRSVYEAARSEFPAESCEEVLLLNERGELCEGTITNLFVDTGTGPLVTPPAACGLLPGVLRGRLLAEGKAVERIAREEDLRAARRLFVGNSLRGLIAARLE